ncbi:SMI1/KNR4 family protein [Actinomadura fibrosa]|uniref:SMI1/KNR4 family protein n=1 Tax=Actinomadura fibrosa TaxID=111802 RepID=A0ABW2XDP0_9ACTN|nr:SMI1/KNR4 family protein [Actinomadura fibrosa]
MTFDIVRDLPAALQDRSGAWTFICGFAESWGFPLTASDGTPESELAAAEHRLDVRLPTALREAYLLFGTRTDLHSNHNWLLRPDEFYLEDKALVFRDENQGVTAWGMLLADLGDPDPAVHFSMDSDPWQPWLDRFSIAAVEIVLSEVLQAQNDLCDYRDLEEGEQEELSRRFTRLPFPAYPEGEDGQRFYAAPGLLLSTSGGSWLSVRARDEQTLDTLRETFPGDWLEG